MAATSMAGSDAASLDHRHPGSRVLRKGRISLPGCIYLVTTVTRGRDPVFTDFAAGCAAARCFEDTRLLGDARMLAWVLMPDHAHWLIRLGDGYTIATVVNRLKSASARNVNCVLHRRGPVWARAFHDQAIRAEEDVRRGARYVVANPLRAGLVSRIADYPFWDGGVDVNGAPFARKARSYNGRAVCRSGPWPRPGLR